MNEPMVKQIDAEKTSMYQNFANKRMLIALISVILGFIIYASIFIVGYTIREQNWMNALIQVSRTPVVSEVSNAQQNANP